MPAIASQPVTYGQEASWARFSVARYQKMIEAGILDTNDKVELLEEYVVLKMPKNPSHDGTIMLVQRILFRNTPAGWGIRTQSSLELSDSQPEPDFAIVRGDDRDYMNRHPTSDDLGIVVEVANTSLLRDSKDKARIYARAGIPIYWIIDVTNGQIVTHFKPSGPTEAPAYADVRTIRPPDSVPFVLDGVTVATIPASDLLP
jgi:Uma2 family endonuclease